MEYLTKQAIFDTVSRHLLAQMKKSRPGPEATCCAYRGYDGTKCPIGCLIPDSIDFSAPNFPRGLNTMGIYSIVHELPFFFKNLGINTDDNGTAELLNYLQWVHDAYEPSEWQLKLAQAARKFELLQPVAVTP
jgi:hypothetical protein